MLHIIDIYCNAISKVCSLRFRGTRVHSRLTKPVLSPNHHGSLQSHVWKPRSPDHSYIYMHRTGRATLQPLDSFCVLVGRTLVGKMMMLALFFREEEAPSVGARAVMKAVHTDGLSFLVRVVSYQTCKIWSKVSDATISRLVRSSQTPLPP